MADEAPAAVDHADSDAMSVEPLSPMVSNAAVPEDEPQAPQTLCLDRNNTSCLTNKTDSLDGEESSLYAIMQPAGLALRNPQLLQPDVSEASAAASLSTSLSSANTANTDSGVTPTASVPTATTQPLANQALPCLQRSRQLASTS